MTFYKKNIYFFFLQGMIIVNPTFHRKAPVLTVYLDGVDVVPPAEVKEVVTVDLL